MTVPPPKIDPFLGADPPDLLPLPGKVIPWYQLFRRPQIVQSLEAVQDSSPCPCAWACSV